MKVFFGIFCAILSIIGLNAFIIPDELPSILSVIYSNIPTFKKGTDSRVGWGFRLGDRADFQVLVELGPQTNTQPLANQGEGAANKRNTLDNLANTLYAQRQQEKKEKQQKEKDTSKSEGGEWLNNWSDTINKADEQENLAIPPNAKPGIAIGEIDAKSVIPDDSALEEMIHKQKLKTVKVVNKSSPKKVTGNRSLVSILTERLEKESVATADDQANKRPLDDVKLK